LRKFVSYLYQAFGILAILLVLNACKSKKATSVSDPKASHSLNTGNSNGQVRFAGLYVDGCVQRMKGNLNEALQLFNECVKIDPTSLPVCYELGTIYKLLGANDKALENAKLCANGDQKNEWYQLLLIACYHSTKQFAQSVKVYENLIKNFPSKSEFKEDLAIEYALLGQYDKALKQYDELEKQYGTSEQLSLNKIKLLKEQKKNTEVEKEYKRLIEVHPGEAHYYGYLAEYYQESGRSKEAKEMFDKVLQMDPKNVTIHLALSNYYRENGDEIKAYEELRLAFLNPDLDVDTKYKIGLSYFDNAPQNTLYQKQGKELSKILVDVHPSSGESHSLYANFLLNERNLKEAAKHFAIATHFDKTGYGMWEQLLYLENDLGLYDSLEKHSAEALEIFPTNPIPYFFNGVSNYNLKNFKKSVQSLTDGLEFVINNKSLMIDFYKILGDGHNQLKDFDKSDKAYEDALKIDSDNLYVLNNYSYFLSLRKQKLERAEKLSRRTNEIKPNTKNYMDTYGWILYQMERFTEAVDWLGRSAAIPPPSAVVHEHYGDALFKIGKIDEAVNEWQKAKDAGGSGELLVKKLKDKRLYE
jgi:tetratricopeptide (TPR) repeat protein